MNCFCGTTLPYAQCCGLYHQGSAAPTPEALMRSRYCAYALGRIDYIVKTMKGKAQVGFNAEAAKKWALRVTWLGLSVLHTSQTSASEGHVEFIARFLDGNKVKAIHENSVFQFENGFWYYVDGETRSSLATKDRVVSRNEPCPCGSLKKFKNCHALAR